MNMLTSQQIAIGTAMKLASDGKQNDPTALLMLIGIIVTVGVIQWIVDMWRWR